MPMQPRYTPADPKDILLGRHEQFDLYAGENKGILIIKNGPNIGDEWTLPIHKGESWKELKSRILIRRCGDLMEAFEACWNLLHPAPDPSVSPNAT